jgi:hypothetical protein
MSTIPSFEDFDKQKTDKLLDDREPTHGSYPARATTSQMLKATMQGTPNWEKLSPAQREALEMNAVKLSRILHGDPNEKDHWDDIAGYAQQAARTLK